MSGLDDQGGRRRRQWVLGAVTLVVAVALVAGIALALLSGHPERLKAASATATSTTATTAPVPTTIAPVVPTKVPPDHGSSDRPLRHRPRFLRPRPRCHCCLSRLAPPVWLLGPVPHHDHLGRDGYDLHQNSGPSQINNVSWSSWGPKQAVGKGTDGVPGLCSRLRSRFSDAARRHDHTLRPRKRRIHNDASGHDRATRCLRRLHLRKRVLAYVRRVNPGSFQALPKVGVASGPSSSSSWLLKSRPCWGLLAAQRK